jgi:hypothetical protein
MFGLFKKKTEIEKLNEKYAQLMQEAYKLGQSSRVAGDRKIAEAEEILKKIEVLKNTEN